MPWIKNTFSCPPGLEQNINVKIDCICENNSCLYGLATSKGHKFGLTSSFETEIGFQCNDVYNFYEESVFDKCLNLPDVDGGEWVCNGNGTCSLRYVYKKC